MNLHRTHNAVAAAVLNQTAPEADIICDGYGSDSYPIYLMAIDVAAQSINGYTQSYDYNNTTGNMILDEYILDTMIPFFVAAGNQRNKNNPAEEPGFILAPGNALNAITVGNYDSDTQALESASSRTPYSHHYQTLKPEIIAPGDAWYNKMV